MQNPTKKRHAHKRSSSLYEEPTPVQQQEQTALVSDLKSELTMKLLEESQTKSDFQVIVDLLHPDHSFSQINPIYEAISYKNEKEKHIGEILSEYFQIQSINFMKNTCQKEEKTIKSDLDLERLENQAKTNSRLRYHRNKKSKAFNSVALKLDFLNDFQEITWDQNSYKMNPCAKA